VSAHDRCPTARKPARPAAENVVVHEVEYEATEHFQVTQQFLNHPRSMLRELLTDQGGDG